MSYIALLVLIILLISFLPSWSYSDDWGYAPAGAIGVLLLILIICLLLGVV